MKLLMTTDTIGGVWVYTLELCKALTKNGVQVHLAAMGAWPTKEQEEEIATLDNIILYKSDFKLEWMQDPWEDLEKARKWINCIYHTVHPDLVHFNNYGQIGNDWSCPTLTVFHSCVQSWWQAVNGSSAPEIWDRYTRIVQKSLNESDLVVGPTHAILENAQKTHQFTSDTKVIYNGRELNSYEAKKKEQIIFGIGRIWDEAKNMEMLSQVAKNLPWKMYIAGDNINPSTGKAVEIENVQFLGKLQPAEVQEWMERASIFVSPTKYEPFGLAILEAAKAGCALVLSELETLKEIWADTACFFQPDDAKDAAYHIMELIQQEDYRNEISERAHARSRLYTSEKMGAEYLELYLEAINKKMNPKLASV